MNECNHDNGVCRTALATPGLLIISNCIALSYLPCLVKSSLVQSSLNPGGHLGHKAQTAHVGYVDNVGLQCNAMQCNSMQCSALVV